MARAMSGLGFDWPDDGARRDFLTFMNERLRHVMQTRGLAHEEVQAATGDLDKIETVSPQDLFDRASELGRFRQTGGFADLAECFKRANGIVDEAWGREPTRI